MDTSTEKSNRTLVLGLGNRVMTDDSAGLFALEQFKDKFDLPQGVDLMDGGTLGLDLLYYIEDYDSVLIADCVMVGQEPGTVVKVESEDIPTFFARALSPHQMGIKDLVSVLDLQGRMPEPLAVVGVQGVSIELGTEPVAVVMAAIPRMVDAMAELLRSWGHEINEKQ